MEATIILFLNETLIKFLRTAVPHLKQANEEDRGNVNAE